ncbi:hypothetical protein GCM10009616_18340 [Microlunatus lacustris]
MNPTVSLAEPTTVSSTYRVSRAAPGGTGARVDNVPPVDLIRHADAPVEVREAYDALVAANAAVRQAAQARIVAQQAVRDARLASEVREAENAADDAHRAAEAAVLPANAAAQALAEALAQHGERFYEIAVLTSVEAQADALAAWHDLTEALDRREAAFSFTGRSADHPLTDYPGLSTRIGVSREDLRRFVLGSKAAPNETRSASARRPGDR